MEVNASVHGTRDASREPKSARLRSVWIVLGLTAIAGYLLFTEHRAHVLGYLPLLLLAICPLMHLFHGHGGGHARTDHGDRDVAHRHDGVAR